MRILDQSLASLGIGNLGRNTVLTTAGLGARAVIQAVYLIALSRLLGPAEYGLFAGTVAAAVVLSPLAGWGASFLYAQRVARDPAAGPAMWAGVVVQLALSGGVLVLVFLAAAAGWLQARLDWPAMLAIAAAELLALPVALAAGRALMVGNDGGRAALALLLVPAARLASLGVVFGMAVALTPDLVAFAHMAGSIVGAALAYRLLTARTGGADWKRRPDTPRLWREGTPYALALGAGTSYPEVDKPLVLQLVNAAAAGAYSAGFRVASLFTLPIAALVAATTPRLFAAGDDAARNHIMKRVTLVAAIYGLVAGMACLAIAPMVPWLFGEGFAETATYVAWLAAWLPLYALHQTVGLRLTCDGRQAARAKIEAAGFGVVVALNFALLPRTGALGAVHALLGAEVFMIAGCWLAPRATGPVAAREPG